MFNSKIFFVIILVLAAAVLVFGYFGFQKSLAPESLQPSTQTADKQKIMQDIGPNATEAEKQEYYLIAKRLAQESESITIKDCKGSPMVLKATTGERVKIINQDSTIHQVTLESGKYKYAVAANSTTEIQFNFFRGKGFYSYGCDRIIGPAGILYVVE